MKFTFTGAVDTASHCYNETLSFCGINPNSKGAQQFGQVAGFAALCFGFLMISYKTVSCCIRKKNITSATIIARGAMVGKSLHINI